MITFDQSITSWIVALGIGMLIGAERERAKGRGPQREPAGIRTFTVAALAGACAIEVGDGALLGVVTAGVTGLVAVAYWLNRGDDPGLTTELSLVFTMLLGGLAMRDQATAAALAVVTAILLAARAPLQSFVRDVLTAAEVRSALIFAAASLVVWPVLPDRYIGPLQAINPSRVWAIVIFILAISAGGYIAVRWLGSRHGLPLAGFASGFVSSSATIAAMGSRAAASPQLLAPAVAGAVLSTVATVVQAALILAATSIATLYAMALPLALAGIAAVLYGLLFGLRLGDGAPQQASAPGEAFSFKTALALAATLAAVLLATAALKHWLGERGLALAVGVAGFADAHAPIASVAAQVAAERLAAPDAVWPVLIALTTNSMTKVILAFGSGSPAFALRVVPGLALVLVAAWVGAFLR